MIKAIFLLTFWFGTVETDPIEPYVRGFYYPDQNKMRLVVDERLGTIDSLVIGEHVLVHSCLGPYGEREFVITQIANRSTVDEVDVYRGGKVIYNGKVNDEYDKSSFISIIVYKQKEGR